MSRVPAIKTLSESAVNQRREVFKSLRAVLDPYVSHLKTKRDDEVEFSADAPVPMANGRPLFFAAVRHGKANITFHFMPIYVFPELLQFSSPALEKRRQGKSCFNFKAMDEVLCADLGVLVRRGFERFQKEGMIP